MSVEEEIRERIEAALGPRELSVTDDSAAHAGHAGAPAGGESHFSVYVRADDLAGISRLSQHRAIHDAIGRDLMGRIHALAIDAGG